MAKDSIKTGVDWRLIRSKRAKNFRELQTAKPGEGVIVDTIQALIDGQISTHGFEFTDEPYWPYKDQRELEMAKRGEL